MAVGKPQKGPGVLVFSSRSRHPTVHALKQGVGVEVRKWQWFFKGLKENREKSIIENKQASCQNKEQIFFKKEKLEKQ